MFPRNNYLNIDDYTNAYWTGSVTDIRSTSGYFTFVGVIWLFGEARNIRWLPYSVQKLSSKV